MIKHNKQRLNTINVLTDIVLLLFSYFLAWLIRFRVLPGIPSWEINNVEYVALGIALMIFTILVFALARRYEIKRFLEPVRDIPIVIILNVICAAVLLAFVYLLHISSLSRLNIFLYCAISSVLLAVKRVIMNRVLMHYRRLGLDMKHVVLVGAGPNAQQYFQDISSEKYLGVYVDGFVGDEDDAVADVPRICGYADLDKWLLAHEIDEMVIALEYGQMETMKTVIGAADHSGVRTSLIPFYSGIIPSHPVIEKVGDTKIIDLSATPLDNAGMAFLKRLGDVIGGCILVALSSPLMLIAVIGVKLSSPGPILFKQERVGKNRKPFYMLKFRSMRVTGTETTGWSTDEDPRKTKFGSFIRKYSIDELPQFFNVIKGDMSLVGPRPEVPFHVEHFKDEIPLYLVRQQVLPGITGWAQIHGLRGDTSIELRVRYDIEYIENWTLWLDIQILFKTLFGGFVNSEKVQK
ncbi:MAG: undecaprenyl-phosphate glucose phosphotransferase [Lachnospiraceae bacterium]|nr:undecaprenyl-phosphate glucose phosphotransferase [Lachnospiraceae bacterium]